MFGLFDKWIFPGHKKEYKCSVCGELLGDFRQGVRLQVSPELHDTDRGFSTWKYATICESCLVKKLIGEVEGEF